MSYVTEKFVANIKQLRKCAALSHEQLSMMLGLTSNTIQAVEELEVPSNASTTLACAFVFRERSKKNAELAGLCENLKVEQVIESIISDSVLSVLDYRD
jgi:DNA-binding XRE family transcriptional regulator